jgi:hypothetical protein
MENYWDLSLSVFGCPCLAAKEQENRLGRFPERKRHPVASDFLEVVGSIECSLWLNW